MVYNKTKELMFASLSVFWVGLIFSYRIYSIKRRGAYLIFRGTNVALIRGRRLIEGGAYSSKYGSPTEQCGYTVRVWLTACLVLSAI